VQIIDKAEERCVVFGIVQVKDVQVVDDDLADHGAGALKLRVAWQRRRSLRERDTR